MRFLLILMGVLLASTRAVESAPCPGSAPGEDVYYCCNGQGGWPTTFSIPVYLNTNITDLCAGASTCSSVNHLAWQLTSSFDEIYSATGTKLRFHYAGTTTQSAAGGSNSTIQGAVHVYASETNCVGYLATAAANGDAQSGGSWAGSGRIRMCPVANGDPVAWAAAHHRSGYTSFRQLFLHEFGHVIGMDHQDECTSGPGVATMGIMRSGVSILPADNISTAYIEYVRDLYPVRTNFSHSYYSTTGSTFYTSANSPPQGNFAMSRLAATNSRSGSEIKIGWRHHNNTIGYSKFDGTSWSFLGFLPHHGWWHVGLASISNSSFMVGFQEYWDRVLGTTEIRTRTTTNGGASWNKAKIQSNADTETTAPGVSTTYDPASQQYITLWRKQRAGNGNGMPSADRNVVVFRLSGASAPGKLTGVTAADTPSIACGPVSVVGTDNCLLAYISDESWEGIVTYRMCRSSAMSRRLLTFGSGSVPSTRPFAPRQQHC